MVWLLDFFIKNFYRDERGNVAMKFAIALMPLVMLIGSTIDLSLASKNKAEAQAMLDNALLATYSNSASYDSIEAAQAALQKIIAAYGIDKSFNLTNVTLSENADGFIAKASFSSPTNFGGIFGIKNINGSVSSQVSITKSNLEIVFVLDNSGSMLGTRLDDLQSAVKNTIDRFSGLSAKFASVKMGVVPFSSIVNVGNNNSTASWMDTNGLSPVNSIGFSQSVNHFNLFNHLGVTWGGCVMARPSPYDISDDAPSASTPSTLFVPWFAPDEFDNNNQYPNNYLADSNIPGSPLDKSRDVTKYGVNGSNPATWGSFTNTPSYTFYANYFKPQGPNFFCDSAPITPLTNNFDSLKTQVDAMQALGGTNLTEGLAWGFRTISPNAPFAEGLPYSSKTQKVIIFFTDGENQVNALNNLLLSEYTSWGYAVDGNLGVSNNPTSADIKVFLDAKTTATCNNIKAKNIKLFTIGLDVTNQDSSNLLKNCASSTSDYAAITDPSELQNVFDDISTQIIGLYLSK